MQVFRILKSTLPVSLRSLCRENMLLTIWHLRTRPIGTNIAVPLASILSVTLDPTIVMTPLGIRT